MSPGLFLKKEVLMSLEEKECLLGKLNTQFLEEMTYNTPMAR